MDSFIELLKELLTKNIKIGSSMVLPFSLGRMLIELFVPVIGSYIIYRIIIISLKKVLKKSKLKEEAVARIFRWVKIACRILIFILFVLFTARLFGARLFEFLGVLFKALNTPIVEGGSSSISLITLFLAIPVFYAASWAGKFTKSVFSQSVLFKKEISESRKFSIINIIRYAVMVFVVLIGMSIIGIDISALTVMFGVLGIGLGFGLQGIVGNLFSGLVLIFSQPVKEKDIIFVEGYEAKVTQIKLLSTVLTTITNEIMIVPNSMLINNPIYNYTYNDKEIIIKNTVDVAYSSDLEKVEKVLLKVASKNEYTDLKKEAKVRIMEFGSSGITCTLLTWLKDLKNKHEALSWTNMEIYIPAGRG